MRLDIRHLFVAFAGVVALAACSLPVQATTVVLYNNLSAPLPINPTYVGNTQVGFPAASFSTGNTAVTLTDVQLNLYTAQNFDPSVAVSLWSDSNTAPGTMLDMLDGSLSVSNTAATVYDLGSQVAPLSILLAANTRYWIQLTQNPQFCQTACNTVYWSQATNDSGTGVSSEYNSVNTVVDANSLFGTPFVMEVQGVTGMTAVSEPPVLPLFALGFLAMVFLGRRRFAR